MHTSPRFNSFSMSLQTEILTSDTESSQNSNHSGEPPEESDGPAFYPALESEIEPSAMLNEEYSFCDANLVIVSTGLEVVRDGWHVGRVQMHFKVHRRKLQSASPVFAELLASSSDEPTTSLSYGLPSLRLEEEPEVVQVLLSAVYWKESKKITRLGEMYWSHVREIWGAARKYKLHMLATYASGVLM